MSYEPPAGWVESVDQQCGSPLVYGQHEFVLDEQDLDLESAEGQYRNRDAAAAWVASAR
jgi:hypothetical protein